MSQGLGFDDAGGVPYPAMLGMPVPGSETPGHWEGTSPQLGSAAILRRCKEAPDGEETAAATTITPGEKALLGLLDTGLTDEAAARQLGVSVRTVRRQMAALMGKLGASSRFQAGHKAAERGWLSDAGADV